MSFGRGGDKAHIRLKELGEDGLVRFDCRQNIQKIIDDFGALFNTIVVSTWDNEVLENDGWRGVHLVAKPDPGGLKREGTVQYAYKHNNKFRQFVGIQNGLLALEEIANVEYVVKIRTDQYVDLKQLIESFLQDVESSKLNKKKVYAPVVHPATFLLHDHYFAATPRTMRDFCEAVLAFDMFEFIDSVHREMVLKHAFVNYREDIGVPAWAYFPISPANGVSAPTKEIFRYMFSHAFASLSPGVLESASWRGSKFSDEYVESKLIAQRRTPKHYSIPSLISIDWKRYFSFLKRENNENIALSERIIANTGMVCWKFWQLIRRLVGYARRIV